MIRPLTVEDVPNIPRLLASDGHGEADALQRQCIVGKLFPPLFLNTPNPDPDIHGLVSTADDGRLTGMIGTVVRRMQFRDRPIRAAVSAELYVDPAHRSKMLGVQLFKKMMEGPQDLSFSDIANDTSRKIWQSLGGAVASWYGLNWVKVIRPGLLPLALISKGRLGKPIAYCGRPLALAADSVLRQVGRSFTRLNELPKSATEPLTRELFVNLFPQFGRADDLRPLYDRATIDWVWPRLDFMFRDGGSSEQVLLRTSRGEPLGWYIYQLSSVGIARVTQIVAHPHSIGTVLDHLLHHAASRGAVAVIGRVVPRFLQTIGDRSCVILRRSTHLLVHSRDSEITDAFVSGRAFLSLLEGEGPMQIWNDPLLAMKRQHESLSTTETNSGCYLAG